MPFSPLGAGFLTGKIDAKTKFDASDFRNISPRFTPDARAANRAVRASLNEIEGAYARMRVTGARLPEQVLAMSNR